MLSSLGQLVRRRDPDRFFATLFAPPEKRETLLVLYAFNHELARIPEITQEALIARIRLQWWREIVDGAHREHEVGKPLRELLESGIISREFLHSLIDAREREAECDLPDVEAWQRWLLDGAGNLAAAAGYALGVRGTPLDKLQLVGAAYGAAGILRSVAVMARQGRCLLPRALLAAHGLSAEDVIRDPNTRLLTPVRDRLTRAGQDLLKRGEGVNWGRRAVAAALPGILARRDLQRGRTYAPPRGAGDRVAVMVAGLRGRV